MILWGEDVKLGPLVVKSLGAHRSRNKKVFFFMFFLCFFNFFLCFFLCCFLCFFFSYLILDFRLE